MPSLIELPSLPVLPIAWEVCRDPRAQVLGELLSGRRHATAVPVSEAPALASLAVGQGLAPFLAWRLGEVGVHAEESGWDSVAVAARRAVKRYLVFEQAQASIEQVIRDEQLEALWLKGFALAHAAYARPSLRPMGDLDVMIRKEHLGRVVRGLRRGGFLPLSTVVSGPFLALEHHVRLRGGLQGSVAVELHYRLHDTMGAWLLPEHLEWFWTRRRTVSWPRGAFDTLDTAAHLLFVCAHAACTRDFVLRSLLDAHLLVEGEPTLDWAEVVERAAWLGWSGALCLALSVSRTLFGTDAPQVVLDTLAQADVTFRLQVASTSVTTPEPRGRKALRALARRRWPHRVRWLMGNLFPPVADVRRRFGVTSRWLVPLCYPLRWLWGAGEVARWLGGWVIERMNGLRRAWR